MLHSYASKQKPHPGVQAGARGTPPPFASAQGMSNQRLLQRRAAVHDAPATAPPIVHDVLASPGQPLDAGARADMELRFGQDFSDVRVHADTKAAESARAVHAQAYTVGRDVVFGTGRYAPRAAAGRQLLAHELAHTVQQNSRSQGVADTLEISTSPSVEREADNAAFNVVAGNSTSVTLEQPPSLARQDVPSGQTLQSDEETALGQRLWSDFPQGVATAFYADPEPVEAKRRAEDWAQRENALGLKGKKVTIKNLEFGKAISDTLDLVSTLNAISTILSSAVAKAQAPQSTPPQAGIGPAKIRTLALFSHGTSGWCGLGSSITSDNVSTKIKDLAPSLGANVNVILYACNTGRGSSETQDWVKGTMESGGDSSIAGAARDALLAEGMSQSSVWGHTTTGHITSNFALREFTASAGKGTAGSAYAGTYVFTATERNAAIQDLQQAILNLGYTLDNPEKFETTANAELTGVMYACYAEANAKLTYKGGTLGETAPTHPVEVADLVKQYWVTYWPAKKDKSTERLIKKLKLKKTN